MAYRKITSVGSRRPAAETGCRGQHQQKSGAGSRPAAKKSASKIKGKIKLFSISAPAWKIDSTIHTRISKNE